MELIEGGLDEARQERRVGPRQDVPDGAFDPQTYNHVYASMEYGHATMAKRLLRFYCLPPVAGWTEAEWRDRPLINHMARCQIVKADDGELWLNRDHGLWEQITIGGGSKPAAAFESEMRMCFWRAHREVDDGTKMANLGTAQLNEVISEARSYLASTEGMPYSKVLDGMQIQSLSKSKPLPVDIEYLIPASNGLINLQDMTLIEYDDDIFVPGRLSVAFNPDTDLDGWEYITRIRQTITRQPDAQIRLLQESIGYGFGFDRSHHKGLQMVGAPRSMKGVTAKMIAAVGGPAGVGYFSLSELAVQAERGTTLQGLYGKRIGIDAESLPPNAANSRRLTNDIKSWTTYEPMVWRVQYGTRRAATPMTAFPILVSNTVQRVWSDASEAVATRWNTVTFDKSALDLPGGIDVRLQKRMVTQDNLEKFLFWAAEGLARLLAVGEFTETDEDARIVRETKYHTVPFESFLAEQVEFTGNPAHILHVGELRLSFWGWCVEKDVSWAKVMGIMKSTKKMAIDEAARQGVNVEDVRTVVYQGGFLNYDDAGNQIAPEGRIEKPEKAKVRVISGMKIRKPLSKLEANDAFLELPGMNAERLVTNTRNAHISILETLFNLRLQPVDVDGVDIDDLDATDFD